MQDLIGQNGSFLSVPHIPENLDIRDYLSVIPTGFEDILKSEITSDGIALTLLNDEYENNTIVIPKIILNPAEAKVQFPRYLIERTTFQNKKIDYFSSTNFGDRYIFNQLELLYIVLQHRLSQFQKQTVAYSYLLKRDISQVASFVQYVPSVAYNSIEKNNNAYIIMSLYSKREETLGDFKASTLGDMIKFKAYIPDDREWKTLAPFLPIHCSSESGASENGKLILRPYEQGALYRSVGHDIVYDPKLKIWKMKSLFKSAQNITARSKTHVTANAYPIMDFKPTSVFIDDWIYDWDAFPDEDNPVVEGYKPKDHCYRRALCVIRPIDEKRSHYLFGEAELIKDHYNSFVWDDFNLTEVFDELVIPTDGTIVYPESKTDDFGYVTKNNRILVGYRYQGEKDVPIYVYDVEALYFVRRKLTDGPEGKERITFRIAKPAGNARCDSNTGFKAVTKAKPYLGKIILEDGTELKPEIAFGMNSFKAKGTGIAAARAALAVDLKTYTPTHWSGLLDSLDEEEMQNASDSLPSFKYYDEFGNYQPNVQIGVIYYRYTEIASTFKSFRDQALSHETGRNLYHNENRDLYNYLWKNYVNPEMAEAMKEMQKVLVKADIYEGDAEMPHYAPSEIRSGSLFNLEEDILTSTIVHQPFNSKVLDEEFNPKGFFIDFTGHGGPLVRVPSARTLKLFENKLESGAWMYHRMFISLSKIIRACLTMPRTGARFNYLFSKPNDKVKRSTLTSRYFSDVKGVIFVSEDSKEMNVTVFSRPMVPGIAMKQVVEPLLPPGTALIMCKDTYDKAVKYCYGEEYEAELLKHSFYGFHVRNPS